MAAAVSTPSDPNQTVQLVQQMAEREGISFTHPARFILVGTMNPEEGDLRPQLLDRFALSVDITGIRDARDRGYTFVSHQQEVGTGYFDDVTTVIQGGKSSVTALTGSTEEEQFH